jgi:hypothetical protein
MMTILSTFKMLHTAMTGPRACHHHRQAEASRLAANPGCLVEKMRTQHSTQQLGASWFSVLQPDGPSLAQPQELGRNQSARVGPHHMRVDARGDIDVRTAPKQFSFGAAGVDGCGSAAAVAGSFSQDQGGLRFSNGTVQLPNGETRPYGNTGIIVVMADGRQFAAGRNSQDSKENVRAVAADKGQQIPVSPPGATTVLYLDEGGNVTRQETR